MRPPNKPLQLTRYSTLLNYAVMRHRDLQRAFIKRECQPSPMEETPMTEQKFPDWYEAQAQLLLDNHYDELDDDVQVAEDEAALEAEGQTLMAVPSGLVPAIRALSSRKTLV